MASIRKEIGELLVDNGQITPEELELAQAERKKTGETIGTVLAKLGLATENNWKNALELQYGVNYVNLAKKEPEEDLIKLLPEDVIREQLAVPVSLQGERITVAMVDPSDNAAIDEIKKHLNGKQLKTVVCLEEEFVRFVAKAYAPPKSEAKPEQPAESEAPAKEPAQAEPVKVETSETPAATESAPLTESAPVTQSSPAAESAPILEPSPVSEPAPVTESSPVKIEVSIEEPVVALDRKTDEDQSTTIGGIKFEELSAASTAKAESVNEIELVKKAQEEAIVLLANQILGSAIKRHCSNIHIQVGAKEALVHYRLNGRLFVDRKLPNTIVTALVARYKMMARLSLTEREMPQDGHIKVKSAAKEIVCLISIVPVDHGENIVIWIV